MAKYEKYTLAVGKQDENRLTALNNICNPVTRQFLDNIEISLQGKHVIDLGCGIGMMSVEFAKRVGPTGKVTAIDISEEQLELAKEYAKSQNINNIDFICHEAYKLHELKLQADMVYIRFLLEHLSQPIDALKQAILTLNPNSYLFCETITSYAAIFSDPASSKFDRWREAILLQPKLYDTDFYIGKHLASHYQALGIKPIKFELQQPILLPGENRARFLSGLKPESIRARYVEKGFFTAEEIQKIADDIVDFGHEDVLMTFPQYIQILGKK